jgi:FkbM family methyltransferase
MSLLAARRVGNSGAVYAFDPAPDTFRLLQENIALNQMKNIRAVNVGLGAAQSAEVIYENRQDNRGMASFIDRDLETAVGVEVPVHTLDGFLAEQGVSTVRMMKIDVEGWELEVLKGAQSLLKQKSAPIISIEYNTALPRHREIFDFITKTNNYQVFILEHSNWHVSSLARVDKQQLPSKGSPNLFCFLPLHGQTVDKTIFKD